MLVQKVSHVTMTHCSLGIFTGPAIFVFSHDSIGLGEDYPSTSRT